MKVKVVKILSEGIDGAGKIGDIFTIPDWKKIYITKEEGVYINQNTIYITKEYINFEPISPQEGILEVEREHITETIKREGDRKWVDGKTDWVEYSKFIVVPI